MENENPAFPLSFDIGHESKKTLVYRNAEQFIYHEALFQNATPNRFYYFSSPTFLFLLKGEIVLQQNQNEQILKQHQGIWIPLNQTHIATLLSAQAILCLVSFPKIKPQEIGETFSKLSSGLMEPKKGRNGVTIWTLWQGSEGLINIESYPAHYKESPYYQRQANQYLLPLNGTLFIAKDKHSPIELKSTGEFIRKRLPRAILNHHHEPIIALSITTPYPEKGRVLVLSK